MWRDLNITKQDWERAPAAARAVLPSLQQQGRLLLIRGAAYEKRSQRSEMQRDRRVAQ
jgi:hypothetical protein